MIVVIKICLQSACNPWTRQCCEIQYFQHIIINTLTVSRENGILFASQILWEIHSFPSATTLLRLRYWNFYSSHSILSESTAVIWS